MYTCIYVRELTLHPTAANEEAAKPKDKIAAEIRATPDWSGQTALLQRLQVAL